MISIFDHSIAVIVGSVALLIIFGLRMQSSENSIEQNSMLMVKKQMLDFAEWLEDDFGAIGEHMDIAEPRFGPPIDSAGQTVSFTFQRDTLNVVGATVNKVRMETRLLLKQASSTTIDSDTLQQYQLERFNRFQGASGWSGWQHAGSSPGMVSDFRLQLLTADGQVTTNDASTEYIGVRVSAIPPFQKKGVAIREIHYGTTIGLPFR